MSMGSAATELQRPEASSYARDHVTASMHGQRTERLHVRGGER